MGIYAHTPYAALMDMPVLMFAEYAGLLAELRRERDESGR